MRAAAQAAAPAYPPDLTRDYPCSWDQSERLASASLHHPPWLRIAKAWRLRDASRLDDIARAWRAIVARHPSLRVAFREHRAGYWIQRALPCEAVEPWMVIRDDAPDDELAALRSRVGLHTGQLFCLALVRRPVGLEIHFTVDHIAFDSSSFGVLMRQWRCFAERAPPAAFAIDDKFLRRCVERAPSPEKLAQQMEERRRTPARSFPPYQLPPIALAKTARARSVEAAKVKLPWDGFSFDARACAAGIGPALLAGGLAERCGGNPAAARDYPMVGSLANRNSREYEQSIGPFSSWFMLAVPVGADALAVKARKVNGRLLNALRHPPGPMALEAALTAPHMVGARYLPYEHAPRYLYANHLQPTPDLVIGSETAEPLPLGGIMAYGLARVLSRSFADGLELEFTACPDLLFPGVTEYLVQHAREQSRRETPIPAGLNRCPP